MLSDNAIERSELPTVSCLGFPSTRSISQVFGDKNRAEHTNLDEKLQFGFYFRVYESDVKISDGRNAEAFHVERQVAPWRTRAVRYLAVGKQRQENQTLSGVPAPAWRPVHRDSLVELVEQHHIPQQLWILVDLHDVVGNFHLHHIHCILGGPNDSLPLQSDKVDIAVGIVQSLLVLIEHFHSPSFHDNCRVLVNSVQRYWLHDFDANLSLTLPFRRNDFGHRRHGSRNQLGGNADRAANGPPPGVFGACDLPARRWCYLDCLLDSLLLCWWNGRLGEHIHLRSAVVEKSRQSFRSGCRCLRPILFPVRVCLGRLQAEKKGVQKTVECGSQADPADCVINLKSKE